MYRDSLRADSVTYADSLVRVTRRLPLFGLDVFRQATTQFQPVVSGPVDASYPLGPGDELVLILTGEVELAHQLEVTREGFVIIPQVGQVYVSNLTLGQLRSLLYDRLGHTYSGVTRGPNPRTKFEVTVARVRVNTVRVVGEVARPGSYQLAATGSVLSGLYEAGGLTERSNFRAVEVRRGDQLVGTVDLYDYLLRGKVPAELRLASGDVVFVPVRGPRVKIGGEVTRPAIYELKPGETLRDLVTIAGGLTPTAATLTATIDRILPPDQRPAPGRSREVVTVDLVQALSATGPSVSLAAGDSVTVFPIHGPRTNSVTVKGSVWQPGTYNLTEGMRFSDLVAVSGGLRPETYEGRAQILRTLPDSTHQMLGFELGSNRQQFVTNPVLRETDVVTVFPKTDFRPQRYVAVYGSVQKPGVIQFADSMTLRDAVLLAGGLRDDAYLIDAEVSRLRDDGSADSLAVVMRVQLDSSYVVDRTGYIHRVTGEATGGAPSVVLHPYDNIFIHRQPGWEVQRNVVLTGEVKFPGRLTLQARDERLTDVLKRAGGLTPQAYPAGIRFFRSQGSAGRIGVDLPRVLREPGYKDNLTLAAGDSIDIPLFIPTVRVEGGVNSPSSVTYQPGAGTDYYISAAGGFARLADKSRTFVQQPDGSVQKDKKPEPGAVVVVPLKDPNDKGVDLVALFGSLAQILGATVTIVVVLTKL
jgi:protein involved in polysaccharide export with SLBB domain